MTVVKDIFVVFFGILSPDTAITVLRHTDSVITFGPDRVGY